LGTAGNQEAPLPTAGCNRTAPVVHYATLSVRSVGLRGGRSIVSCGEKFEPLRGRMGPAGLGGRAARGAPADPMPPSLGAGSGAA